MENSNKNLLEKNIKAILLDDVIADAAEKAGGGMNINKDIGNLER